MIRLTVTDLADHFLSKFIIRPEVTRMRTGINHWQNLLSLIEAYSYLKNLFSMVHTVWSILYGAYDMATYNMAAYHIIPYILV